VLEGISLEKKPVNPQGLALFPADMASTTAGSVTALAGAVAGAGVKPADVLQLTCFVSSMEDVSAARTAASVAFPMAALNFVQAQRLALKPQAQCEAIGRLAAAPASGLEIANGVAKVSSPKLVLSGTQMIFRDQDSDVRLGFQRLGKAISAVGATNKDVIRSHVYATTLPILERVETVAREFVDPARSTAVLVEGLPSSDATASLEFVAIGH
jgi:enamine deaminase RidA (YjgF/YER057c/UK114 family)